MSDIGFNDNVNVTGRKFHVQTASRSAKGVVQCEVFEAGRLITTHEVEFERRKYGDEHSLEERVKTMVEGLHRDTLHEIELMFMIAEKVKKLRHAPSNVKMGLMFLRNNLVQDAIEQFELGISIDQKSVDALNNLGLAYIKLGKNAKAIQILNKALELGPPYADIYHNLGLVYLNEKQHYKALGYFQEALRINPGYMEAHYNLAILYLDSILYDKKDDLLPPPSIRYERSQQQLKKIESDGNSYFKQMMPKIQKMLINKEIDQVINFLSTNRNRVFPNEVLSLIGIDFYLKFMYGGKGLNNDIIKKFENKLFKAIDGNADYADLWNNLGIVHLIQCRNLFLKALTEFDRSLEINPTFDKALKNKKLVENDGKEFLILLRAILK
ncbi:MAG: tetratricopeptide repeat protein [Calditrichaceae bacterium]